jgi:hypothetical protein
VFASRSGWRLRHAHRRPGLAKALNDFSDEIRTWIELALTDRPVEASLRDWPLRVSLYMAWLDAVLLPSKLAIQIRAGEIVTDPILFRASIQRRLVAGPEAATAASLIRDLCDVFGRYAPMSVRQSASVRQMPLAA